MGAIATMTTLFGGIAAGTGATIITEGVVMDVGFKYASTKFGKFCVGACAYTLGTAAFTKVNDMFTEQAIEFWDAVDKFKEYRKGEKTEKEPIDRDSVMEDAVNKLNNVDGEEE